MEVLFLARQRMRESSETALDEFFCADITDTFDIENCTLQME
jgi:hypothetical protein